MLPLPRKREHPCRSKAQCGPSMVPRHRQSVPREDAKHHATRTAPVDPTALVDPPDDGVGMNDCGRGMASPLRDPVGCSGRGHASPAPADAPSIEVSRIRGKGEGAQIFQRALRRFRGSGNTPDGTMRPTTKRVHGWVSLRHHSTVKARGRYRSPSASPFSARVRKSQGRNEMFYCICSIITACRALSMK